MHAFFRSFDTKTTALWVVVGSTTTSPLEEASEKGLGLCGYSTFQDIPGPPNGLIRFKNIKKSVCGVEWNRRLGI